MDLTIKPNLNHQSRLGFLPQQQQINFTSKLELIAEKAENPFVEYNEKNLRNLFKETIQRKQMNKFVSKVKKYNKKLKNNGINNTIWIYPKNGNIEFSYNFGLDFIDKLIKTSQIKRMGKLFEEFNKGLRQNYKEFPCGIEYLNR